jgi:pilus assembly protein CpaC
MTLVPIGAGPLRAQAPQAPPAPPAQAPAPGPERPAPAGRQIHITAGRSTVLSTDFDVTRLALTNPAIADGVVVRPREVLIDGKEPGTISLILWGNDDRREQYDVIVEQPISALEQQLHQLFPSEAVTVTSNADAVILSGHVSNTETMLRIEDIARAAAPKAQVVDLLQVPGGGDAQQVMLQVRVAEVNDHALTQLGSTLFTGPTGVGDWIGRSTTEQFPAPNYKNLSREKTTDANGNDTLNLKGEIDFSDFLNLFLFNTNWNAGMLISALKQTGYFQSLAEPNLIAYNNKEASFLAGGEFPVPIVNSLGQVTIVFKEFGVRLNFTPTIAGDLIKLKVRPEVSALDFNNGITLQGFRIPALSTRRAETEVQLRDGQSFAVAGLMDNTAQTDRAAIPILSQLPIIGALFKSKAERKERTELLVLITPHLVRPLNPDEVPALPTVPSRFLPPDDNLGEHFEGGGGAVDAPSPAGAPAPAKSGRS